MIMGVSLVRRYHSARLACRLYTAAGWAAAAVTAGPPWSDRAMAEAGQAPPWWWGMGTRRPHPPMAVRHHGLVPGNSTRSDRLGAVASPLPQPSPPLSGYGRGAISVDEIIVPIVDIFLDDLKIWIIATAPGPIPAVNTSNYTVHDRQGRTVFRGVEIGGLTWDAVTLGHWLSVELPIVVTDRLAVGIEPAPSG